VDFHKCACPHCGQSIEFQAEGTGQTVPCPTCDKPVTLTPANQPQADREAQHKREWDEWIALNERLAERRIKSGIPPSEGIAGETQNGNLPGNVPISEKEPRQHYQMYCPLCGEPIEIPTASVGQKKACPHCHSEIVPVFFTKIRRKKARSSFAVLTEETIRAKTQTGDTPLHRAAKAGRISEIPSHLLTAELFMLRNNSGATPTHFAAKSGNLDKVPKEFLTKETLTASLIYDNATPLHLAIEYGHADQIPKEFLTPEFLSIQSGNHGYTVLHNLAHAKKLDLVPNIYADSPMWNLRNAFGQTPRDVSNSVIEREQRERERAAWRPPRLTLPVQHDPSRLLPVFYDESLRAIEIKSTDWTKTYIVNLLDYTCTCQLCLEIHSGVPARDFGRLCKHIIMALRGKNLVAQLPPIARGIVENGYPYAAFGIYPGRFATDLNGNPIYITAPNYDGWLNVFALRRRDGVNYYRYGYNVKTGVWNYSDRSGTICHDRVGSPKLNVDTALLY
jgi:ankyrin repeat protein